MFKENLVSDLTTTQFKLLGTVSLVYSDRVVIEPLVSLPVEEESIITIKRITESREELTIAQGTIEQFSNEKIVARIDSIFREDLSPSAMDMVYLEVSAE